MTIFIKIMKLSQSITCEIEVSFCSLQDTASRTSTQSSFLHWWFYKIKVTTVKLPLCSALMCVLLVIVSHLTTTLILRVSVNLLEEQTHLSVTAKSSVLGRFFSRDKKLQKTPAQRLVTFLLVRLLLRFLNPLTGCYSFQDSCVPPLLVSQLMRPLRQHFASEI